MDNELPNDFELIVIGTGMIESMVAAASSRIGKKVLHIDGNDYYGGTWASFNLEGMDKYVIKPTKADKEEVDKSLLQDSENFLDLGNNICGISDVEHHWHIPKDIPIFIEDVKEESKNVESTDKDEMQNEKLTEEKQAKEETGKDGTAHIWTQDKIMKSCRKFNLDVAPKLQFARGDFVELLISSNIARYSEYRSCSRVLTYLNGQLETVPCSRSDVFSNTKVTVVEKRMLMKLLTSCLDNDENQVSEYENKKFINYLKDKKLTPNLIHYVLYAISMSTEETSCIEAVKNTKRFLNSLGRFGKTPFLYSMYGSGELPQAFCRLCAVFGGIYCLNRPVNSLVINSDNECLSVICGNQRINAKEFVVANECIPNKFSSKWKPQKISRAIFITDKSILENEKENLTLLLFPPENGKKAITVIELGTATGTCPADLYVVHLFCAQQMNPKDDLKHCVSKLLNDADINVDKPVKESLFPNVLWSVYYTVTDTIHGDREDLPKNIHPCNGPDMDLDYDNAVKKARDIFLSIYPESEFLPRAPDPEEIILCDDEETEKAVEDKPIEVPKEDEKNEEIVTKTEE